MKAIHNQAGVFYEASTELKNDKEVVMLALSLYGFAIMYLSPELQNDLR